MTLKSKVRQTGTRFIFVCILMMTIGLILRIMCCFWGYPMQLHSDESAIVDYTVDMLERHSWEASIFDRPDHFEIKCNAVLFTAFSWVKYHMPAAEAFEVHKMAFYLMARFFTTIWGVLLIPLAGLFAGHMADGYSKRTKRLIQVITMFFVTFSPIFVRHSAYATPDIVLTFFVLLFAEFMYQYIKTDGKKFIYLSAFAIGIGITIKYPAAILVMPLAIIVIYKSIVNHRIKDIFVYALASIAIMFATIFVIAPNLVTDFNSVLLNFKEEARSAHMGVQGLGFWGNFSYYFKVIFYGLGVLSIVPMLLGVVELFVRRSRSRQPMMVAPIFWICMSFVALHWERWGIPVYIFFFVMIALGIGFTYDLVSDRKALKFIAHIIFGLTAVNVLLSSLAIVRFSLVPDIRTESAQLREMYNLTADNTIYEGYTPLLIKYPKVCFDDFVFDENGITVAPQNADKRYFLMSSSFINRYTEEDNPREYLFYQMIDAKYPLVYEIVPDAAYEIDENTFTNIYNSLEFLLTPHKYSGGFIRIYDLTSSK